MRRRIRPTTALALATAVLAATASMAPAATAQAPDGSDGPIVGIPPLPDAAQGWASTYLDPDYWTDYVGDAIHDGHVNLPYPNDPVKPEAYLPNVPVADSDDYVSALPVDIRDGLGKLVYTYDGEEKTLEQFLTTTRTDMVVLVRDGAVVGEWYRNGYSPEVRHQPWSVTKTFVAAVVGIAFHEGLIDDLQDPIDAYIPELVGTAWEGVTIENLLQMESGVHWDEGTPVLAQNTQVEQWVELALDLHTEGALGATRNEFLASLPQVYEQGSEFRYNSGNTQVLAWLTEVLYGTVFNEVLSEKLWIPMGADGDAVMTSDRVGGVVASHGLFARSHDFARFGELMRNGGATPEGRQVIPEAWVEAMTTMTDVSDGGYGYQTWAHPIAGDGAYSASGFQGQKITVVPDACLTGVRMSHALGADVREGDDPFDPDAYGFATEFYSEEWQTLLAAVADELGPCDATASSTSTTPAGETTASPAADPAGSSLPATGGGLAVAGVLSLAGATALRRR